MHDHVVKLLSKITVTLLNVSETIHCVDDDDYILSWSVSELVRFCLLVWLSLPNDVKFHLFLLSCKCLK